MIMMEYQHFYTLLSRYLPPSALSQNEAFESYLLDNGERLAYEYADFMLMTLPNPRVLYYQYDDFNKIQRGITGYAN